jgi:hypothetical protein
MATLEGKTRFWYEKLPVASLFSLQYFNTVFYEKYKEHHSSFSLCGNYCEDFEIFMQHMKNEFGNEELMDEEIKEFYEDYFQQQEEKVEDNYHDNEKNFQKTVASSLAENELIRILLMKFVYRPLSLMKIYNNLDSF